MNVELPDCVVCGTPTMNHITTWFSAGLLMVMDIAIQSGAQAPCCTKCHSVLAPADDMVHVLVLP